MGGHKNDVEGSVVKLQSKLTKSEIIIIERAWSPVVPYVTGIDVMCKDVYNVAYGQVVYVGQSEQGYTVTVKCNNNELLRYGNLSYVSVNTSMYIKEGNKIGVANRYVHFEYATSWRGESIFPIRVNESTYFKQNPTEILDGEYEIQSITSLDYAASPDLKSIEYDEAQKEEFTGGRW